MSPRWPKGNWSSGAASTARRRWFGFPDGSEDCSHCGRCLCVFPDPHDLPAPVPERARGLLVPSDIPGNLRGPVPRVDLVSAPAMLGTPVPKTTVDEHGDSAAAKDDVCSTVEFRERSDIDSVAQPYAMERLAQTEFRFRVASSDGLHPPADARTRRERLARIPGVGPSLWHSWMIALRPPTPLG